MSLKTTFFSGSVPCELLKTGQEISYHAGDDGDLELGIAHNYTILSAGQYSGTTNIVVNGKTHALSNNCVKDNCTSKMWARYVPNADIGPTTDGKLFWQQWTLAAESCTFATAGDTITAAAGNPFHVEAFCVGRKITIAGTTNNNGVVTVTAIAGNIITVSENLTDEGPVNTTFVTLDDLIWDFLAQANANSLGGHNDWRIPNYKELLSIVDISQSNPSINTTAFPSTPTTGHWVASAYIYNPVTHTLVVYFSYGTLAGDHKNSKKFYVRLVRS